MELILNDVVAKSVSPVTVIRLAVNDMDVEPDPKDKEEVVAVPILICPLVEAPVPPSMETEPPIPEAPEF